jgi:hypothetical protein
VTKNPPHNPDTARKIWLAGIGAYGRAFSEAQESIAKITGESAKIFDDLVAKGEAIERKMEAQGRKVAARVAPGGLPLDERIRRMRERIGLGDDRGALEEELRAIDARLSRVEEELRRLSGPKKPAARRKAKTKTA